MKQRKKSFGMRISAFVLSFAMVCTLLAGVNVVAFAADDELVVNVNKFYNDAAKGGDGEHLFTKDLEEMQWLSSLPTWNSEGVAWKAPASSSTSVWRCYNPNSGEHLYVDEGYADYLAGMGWNKEKVAFYSDDEMGTPIYRLWNGQDGVGSHHFTKDESEAAILVSLGWTLEDVAFYGVKEDDEVVGAIIDNETPSIGDTITAMPVNAEGDPVPGEYKYQWYRVQGADELMIKGANKASYSVGAADVGCSLYCVVTDADGEVFYTEETSKIVTQEITSLQITGMSGFVNPGVDKTPLIPVTGDKLLASTEPFDAGDLVSYQWYRDGAEIVGATSSTYTVSDDDQLCFISVKIKAKDTASVTIADGEDTATTQFAACKPLSAANISLSKSSNIELNDAITVTVKDGSAKLKAAAHAATPAAGDEFTATWFKDTPVIANICTGAGFDTETYTINQTDLGHNVVVLITGIPTQGYYGIVPFPVGAPNAYIDVPVVTTDSANHGDQFEDLGLGNSMTASLPAGQTATFQWYRDGAAIAGATNATYVFTEEDVNATGHKYKVVATGVGNWKGEEDFTVNNGNNVPIAQTTTIDGFGVFKSTDMTTPLENTDDVNIGDVLVASASPAASNNLVTFVWYYLNKEGDVEKATGQMFVVPEDIKISSGNDKPVLLVTAYVQGAASITTWTEGALVAANSGASVVVAPRVDGNILDKNTGWDITAAPDFTLSTKYNYLPSATYAVTGDASDFGVYALALDAYRSLSSNNVVISNDENDNKLAQGYKTYDVPEVGKYAHAYVTPSIDGLYYWWYDATDLAVNGLGATRLGDGQHLRITKEMLGKNLVCVAGILPTQTTDKYCGATVMSTPSAAVIPATRTISEIKVVDTPLVNLLPKTFADAKQVTKLERAKTYYLYGLDSEGNVIDYNADGIKTIWNGSKSVDYLNDPLAFTMHGTNAVNQGIVVVTMIPDGMNYSGESMSYQFTTELKDEETGKAVSLDYENIEVQGDYSDPILEDANGNDVSNTAEQYIWTMEGEDGATAKINAKTGVVTSVDANSVGMYVVTATPKNTSSGLDTLVGIIVIDY